MDLELDEVQEAVVASVRTILDRKAGAERARHLGAAGYDDELAEALHGAGFLDLATSPDAGPLAAALVVEEVSRSAGSVDIGSLALVAPLVLGDDRPARVALTTPFSTGAVRFASGADAVLVVGDREATLHPIAQVGLEPVESVYGYPFARVELPADGGRSLGSGSADRARTAWQIALAAEAAGALEAALAHTVQYVTERSQFGKPLGTLQAIQHRLAEAHIWVQGTAWLARVAAWRHDDPAASACAATYAVQAIRAVAADLHQLSGAIGFTTEFDLHIWTTRLWALRVELGGGRQHATSLARSQWFADRPELLLKGA